MTRQTARKALERRIRNGSPWHGPAPDMLKLSEIGTLEGVFQYRNPLPYKSEAHKNKLARSVKRTGKALGRLEVYWAGDGWVCIDGHHRRAAYQRGELADVPVEVFTGTLAEAVARALSSNTADKLPMDDGEKTAAAWELVAVWNDEFSKSEIAALAGVSTSTVAKMRRVREVLIAERPHLKDLSEFTWRQAQELAKGNEAETNAGSREVRVRRMVDALIKAFGVGGLSRDISLTLEALKAYDEDLPGALRQAVEDDETTDADEETEGAPAADRLPFPGTAKETQPGDF